MAYRYEDLHKKGMLRNEEEVSSSKKRELETDNPEASTMLEVSEKTKARGKGLKLRKNQ